MTDRVKALTVFLDADIRESQSLLRDMQLKRLSVLTGEAKEGL